jgi:integrase
MAETLTDLMLRKLNSGGLERLEVFDERVPGFGVRVSKAGTKTFILTYRHRSRSRRLTLGRYPTLTLADARDKAIDALRQVANGQDPILEADKADDTSYQFDAIATSYVEKHCKVHNKPSTARESERCLNKHFVSAWGKRDLRDITQPHINEILDKLIADGTPSEANHALGVIKTLFNWCVDRDLLAVSPCQKVRKPAKHNSRARVLTDPELVKVWRSFEAEGYPFGYMGKLLVLTAQRRGEVTEMRWQQLDLDRRTWTIPAELAKNSRAHVLPLCDTAMAILNSVPRLSPERVFPARNNDVNAISGFTRAKNRFDKLSGVQEWTIHDIRRTVATGLAQLGVAPHVIERVLNHVSGTFAGVAGVYNRFQYQDEMRAALAKWDAHVQRLVTASPVRATAGL